MNTSTAIMARLFARPEGLGDMMASVPLGLAELGHRLCESSVYGDNLGLKGQRATFVMRREMIPIMKDLREIPEEALRRDRSTLTEVLCRIAVSGFETNVLLREEFDYLVHCLGEGNWQRGLAHVRETG